MTGQDQVKAWHEWLNSDEGLRCADGKASGEYLKNRLWYAFMAGIKAAEKVQEIKAGHL